jgi:hypothetical protein
VARRGWPLYCMPANCQRERRLSPRTGKPTFQVWCKLNRVVPSIREEIPGLLRVVTDLAAINSDRPCVACPFSLHVLFFFFLSFLCMSFFFLSFFFFRDTVSCKCDHWRQPVVRTGVAPNLGRKADPIAALYLAIDSAVHSPRSSPATPGNWLRS